MTTAVSKLGIHSEGAQNTGLQDYCRALLAAGRRPAVVDSHDNYSATFDAAQIDATTLTIGDIEDFKDSFDINELRRVAALNPWVKVWQVYNEIDGDWVGQADRLIEIMNLYGHEFKFCIFNLADGTPPYPHEDGGVAYSNIARACAVAKAGGHYLGLHGYGFNFEDHLFRYRDLAEYLRQHDALCEIVLSEYGPDEGSFIGVDAFMSWCRMVDAELMKDAYIVGAALWTMGRGAWAGVDFSPALPQLAAYQATVAPVVVPPINPDESYSGKLAAYDPFIIDSLGASWELFGPRNPDAGYMVMHNSVQHAGGMAEALLYYDHAVYCTNARAEWYRATATSWERIAGDPRKAVVPPPPADPFWVGYPVGGIELPRITSHFNDSRTYGKHEGIDFDAYQNATRKNAPILAAQNGIVEYVNSHTGESYGLHVVIRHPWGNEPSRYRTLYAHLSSVSVQVGQAVSVGQQIGISGATGTSAIHLHFGVYDNVAGLRGYVLCSDCSVHWIEGVVDPEPLIRYDVEPEPPPTNSTAWRGLHMRADGGSEGADFAALHVAKLNAAKLMSNTGFDELTRLQVEGIAPDRIVLRLFATGDNPSLKSAARFFDEQRAWLAEFNAKGGRYVEVHNEPNHPAEGLVFAWTNAAGFAAWYNDVAFLIRGAFPNLLIGWPGLWPDAASAPAFIASMKASIALWRVDWIGAHSYWGNAAQMNDNENGRWYRRLMGHGKPVIITEFSNNKGNDSDAEKGKQYKQYYASLEAGVSGAFSFVSSASDATFNTRRETWVRNGLLSDIPVEVGAA